MPADNQIKILFFHDPGNLIQQFCCIRIDLGCSGHKYGPRRHPDQHACWSVLTDINFCILPAEIKALISTSRASNFSWPAHWQKRQNGTAGKSHVLSGPVMSLHTECITHGTFQCLKVSNILVGERKQQDKKHNSSVTISAKVAIHGGSPSSGGGSAGALLQRYIFLLFRGTKTLRENRFRLSDNGNHSLLQIYHQPNQHAPYFVNHNLAARQWFQKYGV